MDLLPNIDLGDDLLIGENVELNDLDLIEDEEPEPVLLNSTVDEIFTENPTLLKVKAKKPKKPKKVLSLKQQEHLASMRERAKLSKLKKKEEKEYNEVSEIHRRELEREELEELRDLKIEHDKLVKEEKDYKLFESHLTRYRKNENKYNNTQSVCQPKKVYKPSQPITIPKNNPVKKEMENVCQPKIEKEYYHDWF